MSDAVTGGGSSPFEDALLAAQRGEATTTDVLGAFLDAVVIVPSGPAYDDTKGPFEPLIVSNGTDSFMVVFSTVKQVSKFGAAAGATPYLASMPAIDVVKRLAPGAGIVVNPGSDVGFEILPTLLDSIRAAA